MMSSLLNFVLRITALAVILMGGSAGASEPLAEYRVNFPAVALDKNERIEAFRVSVPCGHIQSVVGIPDDWNVSVARAVSGVEELSASAGHGASYLKDMSIFNGVIHIVPTEKGCFEVTAKITATYDNDRVISLGSSQLSLVK